MKVPRLAFGKKKACAGVSECPSAANIKPSIQEIDLDLLQRQQELDGINDETRSNWEMIRSFLVCGAAFFADAYLMFSSNIIIMIMGYVYYNDAE
ncbi:hypothetical protein LPJ57_003377, partial [Coemansia sp. RSA 486]